MAIPGDRKVDGPELGLQAASLALRYDLGRRSPDSRGHVSAIALSRIVLRAWALHA